MVEHRTKKGADVFPQRELPGRAEEWGRTVEGRIEALEKQLARAEQRLDNDLRALVSGDEVSLNALNGRQIYGSNLIGGRIVQKGGTPLLQDYVIPVSAPDMGGWVSGVGSGTITDIDPDGLPPGVESTLKITSNELMVSPPLGTYIVFNVPERFIGAPIIVSFLAWSPVDATLTFYDESRTILANTWTRVYAPEFTPQAGIRTVLSFTSFQEVWITETWVTPTGRSVATATLETRGGVPGVWFERDGVALGSTTPSSVVVRREFPNDIAEGAFSQTEVFPGGIAFTRDADYGPLWESNAMILETGDGSIGVQGHGTFDVSMPARFTRDMSIHSPINSFPTKAALDDWSAPDGTIAWVTADNRQYARRGGVWWRKPLILAGDVLTSGAANATRVHGVTFPDGFFDSPPTITVSARTSNPQNANVSASAISKDGFSAYLRYTTATDIWVNWVAVLN